MMIEFDYVPNSDDTIQAAWSVAALSDCAKQPVGATILDSEGVLIGSGHNGVGIPSRKCPRVVEGCESGTGYWMCLMLCQQSGHAEVNAIENAIECGHGAALIGSTMFLAGHTYCCPHCLHRMQECGIARVVFPVEAIRYGG